MKTIGQRAKDRREEMELSQTVVAVACGVSQQAIQQLEDNGVQRPRYIGELADILQTTIEWLRTGNPAAKERHEDKLSQAAGAIDRIMGYKSLINAYEGAHPDIRDAVNRLLKINGHSTAGDHLGNGIDKDAKKKAS